MKSCGSEPRSGDIAKEHQRRRLWVGKRSLHASKDKHKTITRRWRALLRKTGEPLAVFVRGEVVQSQSLSEDASDTSDDEATLTAEGYIKDNFLVSDTEDLEACSDISEEEDADFTDSEDEDSSSDSSYRASDSD